MGLFSNPKPEPKLEPQENIEISPVIAKVAASIRDNFQDWEKQLPNPYLLYTEEYRHKFSLVTVRYEAFISSRVSILMSSKNLDISDQEEKFLIKALTDKLNEIRLSEQRRISSEIEQALDGVR